MDISVTHPTADSAVLEVRGQLDIDTAPQLRGAFDGLRHAAVTRIAADLSQLTFCDSIGLSILAVTHRYCVDSGGWLRLAGPNPFLARLLTVVGIADAVPTHRAQAGLAPEGGGELVAQRDHFQRRGRDELAGMQDERLPVRYLHRRRQVVLAYRRVDVCVQVVVEHPEPAVQAYVDAGRLDQRRFERFELQPPPLEFVDQLASGEQHVVQRTGCPSAGPGYRSRTYGP